jgi:hypothetical protein
MAVLSIREIYDVARDAGFTPHQAVTWTAIAMAESRGRTGALNDKGEHSVGLWQVNVAGDVRKNSWGDLTDPEVNARAAYEISRQGTDMRPWTTTHDHNKGTGADYRTYLGKVEAEIGVKGDPRGVTGYGAPRPEPLPESAYGKDPAPVPDPGPAAGATTAGDSDGDGLTDVLEQRMGTNPRLVDSDADGFTDAYEAKAGNTFDIDPGAAIGAPATGAMDADRDGLTDAFEQLTGSTPTAGDSDGDRLSDGTEAALGTNPRLADTDQDGLLDGVEIDHGSDPRGPGQALGAGPVTAPPVPAGIGPPNGGSDVFDPD